jgi:hypothetical protein
MWGADILKPLGASWMAQANFEIWQKNQYFQKKKKFRHFYYFLFHV